MRKQGWGGQGLEKPLGLWWLGELSVCIPWSDLATIPPCFREPVLIAGCAACQDESELERKEGVVRDGGSGREKKRFLWQTSLEDVCKSPTKRPALSFDGL